MSGVDFVRVRVNLDVALPLMCCVGLTPKGHERRSFQVNYEKIPQLCKGCLNAEVGCIASSYGTPNLPRVGLLLVDR